MNTRFSNALLHSKQAGLIPVIPDIKHISPKDGELFKGRDPSQAAMLFANAGAPAISVVTENRHFGGSLGLLESIASAISKKLPILRKDFITSTDDIKATLDAGADSILLICAMLTYRQLDKLYEEALKAGLEPLVEAHSEKEFKEAVKLGARLVGINNRDILKKEKDNGNVSITESIAPLKPEGSILISESSIKTSQEAAAAIQAGADAVLVGTALWQADDMHSFYVSLTKGNGGNA